MNPTEEERSVVLTIRSNQILEEERAFLQLIPVQVRTGCLTPCDYRQVEGDIYMSRVPFECSIHNFTVRQVQPARI
jgi:hypothetical protein